MQFLVPSKLVFDAVLCYDEYMKKILLMFCLFCGMTFALTDTDADGVSDEKDVCPRVYSRSAS